MMAYYSNNSSITASNYSMRNDFGKWFAPSQKKPEVKPIEYAFKDEVDYLKQIINKHDIDITHCLQGINVNSNDCEQMYKAIDILKYKMQSFEQWANYLQDKVESTKRKRKVTICANGQRIEVYR